MYASIKVQMLATKGVNSSKHISLLPCRLQVRQVPKLDFKALNFGIDYDEKLGKSFNF